MSVRIIRYKTHQDWLSGRNGGIGSSEVGTILGCNPYETPYQLWRRKKGLDGPIPENQAMANGHYLEEAVARYYEGQTQAQIIKRSASEYVVSNDARAYMKVSPDRTFFLPNSVKNNENKGILECKSTTLSVDPEDVPHRWFCQLMYQMGVSEMQHGALAWVSSSPTLHFGHVNYEFDSEFYNWMVEQLDNFWNEYMIGDKEPDSESVEDIMIRSPRSVVGKTIDATEDIIPIVAELKEAKETEEQASGKVAELTDKIKLYMGDCESLIYQGLTIATWKSAKDSQKFDSKRFAAENADIYGKYVITSPGARRFLLK